MVPLVGVPETIRRGLAPYREVFCRAEGFEHIAAPGKFESKRFCSDKKVILRGYVTFTHIFVVLYMKEPSHANSQTALSR
jgi:hypothetical protein